MTTDQMGRIYKAHLESIVIGEDLSKEMQKYLDGYSVDKENAYRAMLVTAKLMDEEANMQRASAKPPSTP